MHAMPEAHAGTVLQFEIRNTSGSAGTTESTRLVIGDEQLRLDRDFDPDFGPLNSILFHGGRQELILVDHEERTYIKIDRSTLKEMGDNIAQLKQQLEKELAALPPEQRAMAEQMMQKGPRTAWIGEPEPPPVIRKTSEKASVKEYPCRKIEVLEKGVVTREYWVTSWNELGIDPPSQQVLEKFKAFTDEMRRSTHAITQQADTMFVGRLGEWHELDSVPVVRRELARDTPQIEEILSSAKRTAVGASEFELPENYKAVKFTEGSTLKGDRQ
jgi:hypothetical protein